MYVLLVPSMNDEADDSSLLVYNVPWARLLRIVLEKSTDSANYFALIRSNTLSQIEYRPSVGHKFRTLREEKDRSRGDWHGLLDAFSSSRIVSSGLAQQRGDSTLVELRLHTVQPCPKLANGLALFPPSSSGQTRCCFRGHAQNRRT